MQIDLFKLNNGRGISLGRGHSIQKGRPILVYTHYASACGLCAGLSGAKGGGQVKLTAILAGK